MPHEQKFKKDGLQVNCIRSFNRYEVKYLLTPEEKERFLEAVGDRLCPDKYGVYTICNIYLDTDDFYFIERSLEKPVYKEKLRIRSYGTADEDTRVFFEIKKKFRKVVYKRRITIPLREVREYIENGIRPESLEGYADNQIFSEIDFLMKRYKPSPKLFLAYDREAYFIREYPEMRVTFDKNIRGRWDNLTLKSDDNTELLDTGIEDYSVMEIKCMGAMPREYAEILSRLKIYPASFSKYGRIYTERCSGRTKSAI